MVSGVMGWGVGAGVVSRSRVGGVADVVAGSRVCAGSTLYPIVTFWVAEFTGVA